VRRLPLVVACLATLLLGACGRADPAGQAAPTSRLPAADIHGTLVLKVQDIARVGEVVVDGDGYPLYRYDKDTTRPPQSNCLLDCWSNWPPVVDTSDIRLDGIDRDLVGTVVRPDSTKQLTIAGSPVYRYAGDTAPGQANGQGADKLWSAITPTGRKAVGGAG
jgi:predicted lipoprotein with Yx(FWY)xxD motif